MNRNWLAAAFVAGAIGAVIGVLTAGSAQARPVSPEFAAQKYCKHYTNVFELRHCKQLIRNVVRENNRRGVYTPGPYGPVFPQYSPNRQNIPFIRF